MKREKKSAMTRDEFREQGIKIVNRLYEYMSGIEKYPVRSKSIPGETEKKIGKTPPIKGEDMESILGDFEKIIMPGITHWQHPSFFAYFPANASPPSILAEFLTAGLGVNAMLWETSPAATELEKRMMQWLSDMLGLPSGFEGVIQDTASTASLCALLCARERATGFKVNERGFDPSIRLRVYVSCEAHSSIEKGVKIAGYGRENLVKIESDGEFRMIPGLLEDAIKRDIESGFAPCAVVATVGTTSSTSVDPVRDIGIIAQKYGLWLHVDAAHAGTAAILPEKRHLLDGIEYAQSFVFNPHKWMLTNFDCSAFFVRDSGLLKRTFSIDPEYLKTGHDEEVINYRDWGIQLGRRFRALKLWFVIRSYGTDGLRAIIRDHIEWAGRFARWVDESANFEILAPVTVNLVCFRYNPDKGAKGVCQDRLEALNKRLMDGLNGEGKIYLTHTRLKGRFSLRFCVGQANTAFGHVERAWELIKEAACGL